MLQADIKALLLDISGVIYQGSELIDGAVDTIARARQRGLCIRFVTNTASKSTQQLVSELRLMGIEIADDELFTAPKAARAYIDQRNLHPYCLLPEAITGQFDCYSPDKADAVLLGDARDGLNYSSLNAAFSLCQAGAPLIAIGMNRYFMSDNGLQLDAGPFVKALEWAAQTEAKVMGKPGQAFFLQAVASTGFESNQCLMVGDDVETDVLAALDSGLNAVLVQTGKYRSGDELSDGRIIDVIPSLATLFDYTG